MSGLSSGPADVTTGPESPPILKHCDHRLYVRDRRCCAICREAVPGPFWWKRATFAGSLLVRMAPLHGGRLFASSQSLLPNLQYPCWCRMPPRRSAALPVRALPRSHLGTRSRNRSAGDMAWAWVQLCLL